jgi:transcription elongation GreA/GreB family factor
MYIFDYKGQERQSLDIRNGVGLGVTVELENENGEKIVYNILGSEALRISFPGTDTQALIIPVQKGETNAPS